MQIYLVKQSKVGGYDTCSQFVTVAKSEEEARNTHPCSHPDLFDFTRWNDDFNEPLFWESIIWVKDPSDVTVILLGEAKPSLPPGIVIYSFHHG